MGKRHFNEEWLSKPDSNSQAISSWCVKKDYFTATCKLCNTDINIAHMGYSVVTQYSEKKHKGFSLTLEKVKDHEEGKELEKSKSKECQKVLLDFFVKSSEGTSKPTTSSQESGNSSQDKRFFYITRYSQRMPRGMVSFTVGY